MSEVQNQAGIQSEATSLLQLHQLLLLFRSQRGVGIGTSMQFLRLPPSASRNLDLSFVRIDEQADFDHRGMQAFDRRL